MAKAKCFWYMYGTGMSQLADYINQLRYERLMAKAKCFWYKSAKMQMADQAGYAIPDYDRRIDKIENIALSYGARARRIKEGM